jgi:hypothetical protein
MRGVDEQVSKRRLSTRSVIVAAAVAAAACTTPGCSSEAQFTTQFAPEYPKTPHATASVFGVYKDGRMSSEAWEDISRAIAPAFGRGPCEAAFGLTDVEPSLALSAAVDDYARADGPDDELLDVYGPLAEGDLVLVVSVAGHPQAKTTDPNLAREANGAGAMPARGIGRHGSGQMGGTGSPGARSRNVADPRNTFEVAVSVFSPQLHRSVGVVALAYSGQSTAEAFQSMANKLRATLPNVTCVGWKRGGHVDAQRLQALLESK